MASRPGGLTNARDVSDEEKQIANQVKSSIEQQAGQSFSTFNPVKVATQVVAGTNYFFKIDVGGGHYVHARVYRDLSRNLSVHSVQTGKSAGDPLEYF